MLTRKIKEALSRAHLVCAEKTVCHQDLCDPDTGSPEAELCKAELRKGGMVEQVIEAAVTRHMTDECVQFSFNPAPYPDAYLSEGLLRAGLVVMSPKDFNELRRLIAALSESYEHLSAEFRAEMPVVRTESGRW